MKIFLMTWIISSFVFAPLIGAWIRYARTGTTRYTGR